MVRIRAMLLPRNAGPRFPLGVVFVQEGTTGPNLLAPLVAALAEAGVEDPAVAVVDRSRPAGWVHPVHGGLFHVGGEPGSSFEAAARAGAALLADRCRIERLVVADGSLAELGHRGLALLDDYALSTMAESTAVLGFVDRPRDAPGLLLVPVSALLRATPAPAETAASGSSRRPGDIADRESGARAERFGMPVLDLRLVRRLRDQALPPGALSREALVRLAGRTDFGDSGSSLLEPRIWVDEVHVPETLRHGESGPVVVRGWVVAPRLPRRVVLLVDGREVLRGDVSVRRPDVLASLPELEHESCGFELRDRIGPLAPGAHVLECRADGTSLRYPLGTLRVLPVHRLEVLRTLVPERVPAGEPIPVVLEGRVISSDPAPAVEASAGGRALRLRGRAVRSVTEGRPASYEFVAAGRVPAVPDASAPLAVELRSSDLHDMGFWGRTFHPVTSSGFAAAVVEQRDVGDFDPRRGVTVVSLRGVVFGADPGGRVMLREGARTLASVVVSGLEAGDPQLRAASFALETDVAGLGPGEHELDLVLVRPQGGRALWIERWQQGVRARGPAVRSLEARAEPLGVEPATYRLVAEGEIESADLVESLALAIDGAVRTRLGGEWLRPAPAGAGVEAKWHGFRFDAERVLEPGRRRLEVRARLGSEEVVAWTGELEVPAPQPPAARLRCGELDRLVRDSPAPVWSRLVLEGDVVGAEPGSFTILRLDGRDVAQAEVDSEGRFRIESRPDPGHVQSGVVEVRSDGATLERSPPFHIAPRPLEISIEQVRSFARLLPELLPGGLATLPAAPAEILRRMLERQAGAIGPLTRAIDGLVRRRDAARARPGTIVESPGELPDRRLAVLFAAWEVPCSRHGGGVCMVNLLRHLGARHDVTLVHAEAPGEEGLAEQVRPFVREILAVRREWRAPTHDPEFGVPSGLAWSLSPRLREVLEAEVASGRYDLVNYEYTEMALHRAVSGVPATGALYELHSFARLARGPGEALADAEATAAWLGETVAALHYETAVVAERFPEMILVSRPEAEFLASWLTGRRFFVNPIPIDAERFSAQISALPTEGPPLFVFVGNYIHPPNQDAARVLIEQVAPAVLARRPDARFVIAGPHPPEDLHRFARPPAIEVVGFVPDLGALLAEARAFLAPIESGGGMRVKLLEAMAAGCPVVSTPLGFNGIAAAPGREVIEIGSVSEMVAMSLRLADDPAFGRNVGRAGRALVEREFGISVLGERRERIWQAALEATALQR